MDIFIYEMLLNIVLMLALLVAYHKMITAPGELMQGIVFVIIVLVFLGNSGRSYSKMKMDYTHIIKVCVDNNITLEPKYDDFVKYIKTEEFKKGL